MDIATVKTARKVMGDLVRLEGRLDSLLTWAELNDKQRGCLTDAANRVKLASLDCSHALKAN